jgi:hypothetical protein
MISESIESNGFKIETPATYRIRVQGRLDQSWSDQLNGMAITQSEASVKPPVVILFGHLRDQAALLGVLNNLYELHLPLLSVENLDER